ncbi:MAG TPA: DUF47 family protein [Acidobacteriota bacterium]|jgi:hypothetical protein|nr:DUF47 family protein [Acidobacteriota bacterium]
MALIRFLQKDEKFTDVFRAMTSNLTAACQLLEQLLAGPTDGGMKDRIKEHEHQGDLLVKEVIQKLDITFITPFDREDIHRLSEILDDVVDLVYRAASKMTMYKIRREVPGSRELAKILTQQSQALEAAVTSLRNYKEALAHCERVNELERGGDAIYAQTMSSLFDDVHDPIELIKLKEIVETVESALNRSEDVADVIESIVIKNS